jgi:hypothetical protein
VFWDVAVNDMSLQVLSELFNYADDSALWIEFDGLDDLIRAIDQANNDLQALLLWGDSINLTFESAKNTCMIVSRTHQDFSKTLEQHPIMMEGDVVRRVSEIKLVGFVFDEKLTWTKMISQLASRARSQLGALFRMRPVMNDANLATMYKAFVRSVMEFGNLEYMSAASTHLSRLDAVQHSAQRICNIKFETLGERREAASFGMMCKLLDGEGRGELQLFAPVLLDQPVNRSSARFQDGLHLQRTVNAKSLKQYERSFCGSAPVTFSKLPQELLVSGKENGWCSVMKKGQRFLCGRG